MTNRNKEINNVPNCKIPVRVFVLIKDNPIYVDIIPNAWIIIGNIERISGIISFIISPENKIE